MEPTGKPGFLRLLRKVLLIISGAAVSLVLLVAFALYWFEDDIKGLAINEINKHLKAKVNIRSSDINLTFFSSFPDASIEFSHFRIEDSTGGGPLAEVGALGLQFSPLDLARGKYDIRKIILKDANIRLKVDEQGRANYDIWKFDDTDTTSSSSGDFALNLEKIILLRVKLAYQNAQRREQAETDLRAVVFSGSFTDKKYEMTAEADMFFKKLVLDGEPFIANKNLEIHTGVQVDNTTNTYTLSQGKLNIEKARFDLTGTAQIKPEGTDLDLKGKCAETSIRNLISLLPPSAAKALDGLESDGRLALTTAVKGLLSATTNPRISADFNISGGRLKYAGQPMSLSKVNLKGSFTNGAEARMRTAVLRIDGFNAMLNGREASGNLLLRNLSDPYLECKLKADIELSDVASFADIKDYRKMTGHAMLDASFQGRLADLEKPATVNKTKLNGSLVLRDVHMIPKANGVAFKGLSGEFRTNGKDLLVNAFSGAVQNTKFNFQGSFRNLAPFLFLDGQPLEAVASLEADRIDMADFLQSGPATASSTPGADSVFSFRFPPFLFCDFNLRAGAFRYGRMEASDIAGRVQIRQGKATFSGVRLRTMDGAVTLDGEINQTKSGLLTTCSGDLQRLGISRMFYQLENFGQTYLTDKHLHGKLTGHFDFSANWNNKLEVDPGSIYTLAQVVLDEGELNNFDLLMEMGDFLRSDAFDRLKFDRLQNTITIKDQVIYIPRMDINSSAMNMGLEGKHTFDNVMDFRVKVNASQALFGKHQNKQTEFGEVAVTDKGGLNVHLLVSGPVDKLKIQYDSRNSVKGFKENVVAAEGEELKKIFSRKSQSTGTASQEPDRTNRNNFKSQPDYELDWSEEGSAPQAGGKPSPKAAPADGQKPKGLKKIIPKNIGWP